MAGLWESGFGGFRDGGFGNHEKHEKHERFPESSRIGNEGAPPAREKAKNRRSPAFVLFVFFVVQNFARAAGALRAALSSPGQSAKIIQEVQGRAAFAECRATGGGS